MKRFTKSLIGLEFLAVLAVLGCTEPYAIRPSSFEEVVVIEAPLTNENKQQEIKISSSYRFGEDGPVAEPEANVYITDDQGGNYDFAFDGTSLTNTSRLAAATAASIDSPPDALSLSSPAGYFFVIAFTASYTAVCMIANAREATGGFVELARNVSSATSFHCSTMSDAIASRGSSGSSDIGRRAVFTGYERLSNVPIGMAVLQLRDCS